MVCACVCACVCVCERKSARARGERERERDWVIDGEWAWESKGEGMCDIYEFFFFNFS